MPEGIAPAKNIKKIIVFLTDGLNAQNRWTTKAAEIDARTKLSATTSRRPESRFYTVRVMEGNQALLQACASSPGMYYNVAPASRIKPVFEEIARGLSQLRISR